MPKWLLWVIIAVVVIALLVALLTLLRKNKATRDRAHAGELREEAAARATEVQKRDAHARETEAEAAAARAEADRKQAQAERLAAEAEERRRVADADRSEHEDRLRRADELDPDVDTRSDDYAGPSLGTTGDHDGSWDNRDSTLTARDGSSETMSPSDGTVERETVETRENGTDRPGGGSHSV